MAKIEIKTLLKSNESDNPRKKFFDKELEKVIEEYKKIEKIEEYEL